MNQDLWQEMLILASLLVPIITGLTTVFKAALSIKKNFIPLIAIALGLLISAFAGSFTPLPLDLRLWAGGLAGLASTGLYEVVKKREGKTKGIDL